MPVTTRASASDAALMNDGRASMKCGSSGPLVRHETATSSPPTSRASSRRSVVVVSTFTRSPSADALETSTAASAAASASGMRVMGVVLLSVFVGAVDAEVDLELQPERRDVVRQGLRAVAVDLEADLR